MRFGGVDCTRGRVRVGPTDDRLTCQTQDDGGKRRLAFPDCFLPCLPFPMVGPAIAFYFFPAGSLLANKFVVASFLGYFLILV